MHRVRQKIPWCSSSTHERNENIHNSSLAISDTARLLQMKVNKDDFYNRETEKDGLYRNKDKTWFWIKVKKRESSAKKHLDF